MIRCLLLGTLLASQLSGVDTEAVFTELHPHLISGHAEERTAALLVLLAVGTPEAAEIAVTSYDAVTTLSPLEQRTLVSVLRLLSESRMAELIEHANQPLADHLAQALSYAPPDHLKSVITAMLQSSDPEVVKRAQLALQAVFSRGASDPALHDLVLLRMQSGDEQQRAAAVRHLPTDPQVQSVLEAMVTDHSGMVREAVVERMRSMPRELASPPGSLWARPLLVTLCQDGDPAVQCAALDLFAKAPVLADTAEQQLHAAMPALLADQGEVGLAASRVARRFVPDEAVCAQLELRLKQSKPRVAAVAFEALGASPKAGEYAVALCTHPDPDARLAALAWLVSSDDRHTAAIAQKMLADPDYQVRAAANAALVKAASLDPSLTDVLTTSGLAGADLTSQVRRLAALEPSERPAEFERLYQKVARDKRREFIASLAGAADSLEYVMAFLCAHVHDSDPSIASAAITALPPRNPYFEYTWFAGMAEALTRVDDANMVVAKAALTKAEMLPYPSLKRWAKITSRATTDEDRASTGSALAHSARAVGHATGAWDLEQAASDIWSDPSLWPALFADPPSTMPPGAPFTSTGMQTLLTLYETLSDEQKRSAAIILGRIPHPGAVAALTRSLRSSDRFLRWAARDALLAHGDESDEVLDHWLAHMLQLDPPSWSSQTWPLPGPRPLDRLATFAGLAPKDRIDQLRALIESGHHDGVSDQARNQRPHTPAPPVDDQSPSSEVLIMASHDETVSLEKSRSWTANPMDTLWDPLTLKYQSGRGFHIDCAGGDKEKCGVAIPLRITAGAPLWVRVSACLETGGASPLAIALWSNNQFFESEQLPLPADHAAHVLAWDLTTAHFKCAATDWKYTAPISSLTDITKLMILVYNGHAFATMTIDGVSFLRHAP